MQLAARVADNTAFVLMNDSVFYECEEVAASVTAISLEPTLGEPRDFNHFPACRGVLTISLPGVFVLTVLIPHKNSLKEEELALLLLLFVCFLFVFGVVIWGWLRPVNKDGYVRANGLKDSPRQPEILEFKTTDPHGNAENTGPYGVT